MRVEHVDPVAALAGIELRGKPGYVDMRPCVPSDFEPIVDVPDEPYELIDVDTGADFLNVTPDEALERIRAAGRSPLTIGEGVAVVAQQPDILRERNCFSMLGSRRADKRVPALWVTRDGRIRLGWCWAGNPHSWLGSASCADRVRV